MNEQKIWDVVLTVLGGLITGVIGLFTGWWLNRQQRADEKAGNIEERKRAFLAFMESWKHEIGRLYRPSDGGGGFETRQSSFDNLISTFKAEARAIRPDFHATRRKEFDDLCIALIGGKHRCIYGSNLSAEAQRDMDNIMAFVESHLG